MGQTPLLQRWLDWATEGLTAAALRRKLAAEPPRALGLAGIPNARLVAEVEAEALLQGGEGLETVADLQAALAARRPAGIEPEELWGLARDLPYRVEIHWGARPGTFNAVLRPTVAVEEPAGQAPAAAEPGEEVGPPDAYANSPLRERLGEELSAELQRFLAERLPGAEAPVSFVLV